jgi:NAD(P)-dependent dehydrogenase (short-subunit alcohol dehydrogenase family)
MSDIASPIRCITGCFTGFDRELAKRTIAHGWPTVVTVRHKNAVADLIDGKDNVFAIDLDVTSAAQIAAAVASAEDRFGRIDVLANNAGRGRSLRKILKGRVDEFEKWRDVSLGADFPAARRRRRSCRSKR